MQTLTAADSKTPTMLSIWSLRAYILLDLFLVFAILGKSLRDIEYAFWGIILTVILIIVTDLSYNKNIVYLSDDVIILKGVFNNKYYFPEDFVRISVYNKYLSVAFIEFTHGKKYHILTREIPFTPHYADTLKDYTHIAAYLDYQVRDYFKK